MNESTIPGGLHAKKAKMAFKMKKTEKKDHVGMTAKESYDYQRRVGRAYND